MFENRGKGPLRTKFKDFGSDDLAKALDYLFSGPFLNIEPYRGSKSDRTDLRYQTSYLIGEFVEKVTRNGGSLDVEPGVKAQVAVLKELAWYYVITDPSLATIQRGQRVVIEDLHDIYCDAVSDKRQKKWQLFPLAFASSSRC